MVAVIRTEVVRQGRGRSMQRSRLQFTLRTLFIILLICAVVCSLVKCERDARRNFDSVVGAVETSLAKAEQEADADLYQDWLKEARANPTLSHLPKDLSSPAIVHAVIGEGGSGHGRAPDYFGSTQDWRVARQVLSPRADFSKTPWEHDPQDRGGNVINVTIRCSRPCSIISRQTSLSIAVHPAAKNPLLLNTLKTLLDEAGLSYVVTED